MTAAERWSAPSLRRWQTGGRPVGEQYAYWREVVCAAFTTLSPATRGSDRDHWDRPGLPGWVDSLPIGSTNAAEVESCEQLLRHGRAQVAAIDHPVVFINLQLRGRSLVSQDGRTCLSGPGTFSLVDATRPFTLDYLETWRTVSFRLPLELVGDLTAPGRSMTARPFSASRGIGRVLAQTMRSLWAEGQNLTAEAATAGAAAVGVLALALDESGVDEKLDHAGAADSVRQAIDDYVRFNVEHADLRPEAVARNFGISVRRLHQLYEDGPCTFGQMVMSTRATCCAEMLLAEPNVSLTEAAARWGFSDLSHMNRVFRRLFGHSSSELRGRAGANESLAPPAGRPPGGGV